MDGYKETRTEVICQHGLDGTIMPIKLRFQDERGEWQSFKVMRFQERAAGEPAGNLIGSVSATSTLRVFDCRICVFGSEKPVLLYYNSNQGTWKLRYELA